MALNPLVYTEKVVRSFLRYQLTTYPFADPRLDAQLRDLLSLGWVRHTPLLQGPFVTVSRAFREGAAVAKLVAEGILHPHLEQISTFPQLYGHQEEAIRAIASGATTLISTGTGSGKSECFLYPIISRCLELRDTQAPAGICAVIVYPMNALAEDQLGRLRELLAGSGVTFGMYVRKTPDQESGVRGVRLRPGSSRADYRAALAEVQAEGAGTSVHPPEEVCSRERMRTPGGQPRILLTNVQQLELLLTRQSDTELFRDARLDFLVFDEAHTFSGALGAETACMVRRLRSYCGREAGDTVCVATSATIVDPTGPDAARDFASRFFGVEAAAVETVGEHYAAEDWAGERAVPGAPDDPPRRLAEALLAVDAGEGADAAVRALWRALGGRELPAGAWEEALHAELARNEVLYQAAQALAAPRELAALLAEVGERVGRAVSEEELVLWLTLGAAARAGGRPLVRPVVHGFVRGVPGAVVTFEGDEPRLHLSAEDEAGGGDGGPPDGSEREAARLRLPVATCKTCGQHYFQHSLGGFEFTGASPAGGQAEGDASVWLPLDGAHGGVRVLLLDRLIGDDDDAEEEEKRLARVHLCVVCGAGHPAAGKRCLACGAAGELLPLWAVQQKEERPGKLASCVACRATGRALGGRYLEPIKPVRATNVADVHVLAQDMVHSADRPRLLVFADNRQDAAFQSGWMRDHARRFRLRSLMAQQIAAQPLSIHDLTYKLEDALEADDAMSAALLPEVWSAYPKDVGGQKHREERRYFLRIMILRELTTAQRQQIGLEPWGRLRVGYEGLSSASESMQSGSHRLKLPPDDLVNGVAAMLDQMRRDSLLLDRTGHIFSKFWDDGAREIQDGYLPKLRNVPRGVKLARAASDDKSRLKQWLSTGPPSLAMQIAAKWGVPQEQIPTFLEELWDHLKAAKILAPVTLQGWRGNALPNTAGAHQIDADRLMLAPNRGAYRCTTCRRRTVRRTPYEKCLAWRCAGQLEYLPEDPDNYDLQLIDQSYTMLRPREHTAMVPHDEREQIEQLFKGATDEINVLVCTQTLELGVDIGTLDSVLMRNVPPLAANYWQRAGRAGRRHRMAVNLTYCRTVSHDRAYFDEPLKLLGGRIDPPAFNLANEEMVGKHVHATVLTRLNQLAGPGSPLGGPDREEIRAALLVAFPVRIREYLFDAGGLVRSQALPVTPLITVVTKHQADLEAAVARAFGQGWPAADAAAVAPERLAAHIAGMGEALAAVVQRLWRRLQWAMRQMDALEKRRKKVGSLDGEDRAFYDRCERLIKKLKGEQKRKRSEAEGIDDTLTFGVLAREGFLPGYGLDSGSVRGMAEMPKWVRGVQDFDLPRPPSVAVREYVPGNLIYANGQRFVPRRYARDVADGDATPVRFEVNAERRALRPAASAMGDPSSGQITSIPICDVTLVHTSRISDEEDTRFQMGVAIYGRELGQHDGGYAFHWGERPVHLRHGVRLQLVNVGASLTISGEARFGYPVCMTCGQSASPLSSEVQRNDFERKHLEWCGQRPTPVGFHAELVVDALSLPACADRREAYTLAEALRFGASELLEMELEDLQVLVLGEMESDQVTALLYDPMPGGSGLLDQLCKRFPEAVAVAERIARGCPSQCSASCIDCFQTYRNGFYHSELDRKLLLERIGELGGALASAHAIPPQQPGATPEPAKVPVNVAERNLRNMLVAAQLPQGAWQQQVPLPKPLGSTTPDVAFEDPDDSDRSLYVYLDGLSRHLHGNPETHKQDLEIRNELRAEGHEVIQITAHDLDDQQAMTKHFKRIAKFLVGSDATKRVAAEAADWFAARAGGLETSAAPLTQAAVPALASEVLAASPAVENVVPFVRVDDPGPRDRFRTCVPIFDLRLAAGAFGTGREVDPEGWASLDVPRKLKPGMFVAQVHGPSMEQQIPDGSWCLFTTEVAGSRYGRILVVQHREAGDPSGGGSYTLKRYERPPQDATRGEVEGDIPLRPFNPEVDKITLTEGMEVEVVAELLSRL